MQILGQLVEEKILSKDSKGGYYVFHMTISPGAGVPPHVHTIEDEIITVLSGEMEIFLDGKVFQASTGDVLNFPIGVPHGFQNKSEAPCIVQVVVTPGTSFQSVFGELSQLTGEDMGEVVELSARNGMTFLLD